jgi:anti-sigma factor RsiW
MKPCPKNRKPIALLALDALPAQPARSLRAHIEQCDGCRAYFEETLKITRALQPQEAEPELEATESFHRAVARAIRTAERTPPSVAALFPFRIRLPRPRATFPTLGAIAAAVVALCILAPRLSVKTAPSPPISSAQTLPSPGFDPGLRPTLANYNAVANRSLDDLDDLLTRQANRRHSPAPIYRASILGLADFPE